MPVVIQRNQYENITGLILLFTSIASVLFTGIMYYKHISNSLLLTTTTPFVDFRLLYNIYIDTKTTGQSVNISYTNVLLNKAWCNEKTGNYYSTPQTRAPACTCINNIYAMYMRDVLSTQIYNDTILLGIQRYIMNPYNGDTVSAGLLNAYKYNTNTVPINVTNIYADMTLKCLNKRAVWRIFSYTSRLHPILSAFYTSYCMFIFAFSYLTQVESIIKTGVWAKYLLLVFSSGVTIFLLYMDFYANWMYAIGVILVNLNYTFALGEEFTSIEEKEQAQPTGEVFNPPHPLSVGAWNYVMVSFPVLVVYMGCTNYMRDTMGLVGLYVIGYGIVSAMQRLFWCKWYLKNGMKIETYQLDRPHTTHILDDGVYQEFSSALQLILGCIYVVLLVFGSICIYMNWYVQGFMWGNWVAMVMGILYVFYFGLEFTDSPEKIPVKYADMLQFNGVMFTQILLLVVINSIFCISTVVDCI